MTHYELARTTLGHVVAFDAALQSVGAYESTEPVEAAHMSRILVSNALEGDYSLALLERQHEVIVDADVNRLEAVVGDVQCLEWNLDVCKCQLAKIHLHHVHRKSDG